MFSFSCIVSFLTASSRSRFGLTTQAEMMWLALVKARGTSDGLLYRRPDEVYYRFERGSGLEHSRDAQLLQLGSVLVRNYTSDGHQDVQHAFLFEQLHHPRNDRIVRAGEDGQSDNLDVFLQSGVYDHLRGLAQAGVYYFHARVAESPRDNLRSPVVAIQTRFGDQYPDAMIHTAQF